MKIKNTLLSLAAAFLFVGVSFGADAPPAESKTANCCAKADGKGEKCEHACCVTAAKDSKNCEKCGGSGMIAKK